MSRLADGDVSVLDSIRGLGVTKQAASQLLDTLVLRGFLVRDINPEDRRRMTIDLTERGHAAAAAIYAGTDLASRAGRPAGRASRAGEDQAEDGS